MPQRAEPRLARETQIRIFGLDSQGHAVNIAAKTLDISKHGARLSGVWCWQSPGETIGIRHGSEKARYQVVWVGRPGSAVEGQIGVRCVEVGKYIWGVDPAVSARTGTQTMPGPVRGPDSSGLRLSAKTQLELRRRNARFKVNGSANVREVGKNVPQWTTIHDLSMGGCYLETTAPLPPFSRVELTLHVGDVKIDAGGSVTAKHPLVGMGIKFTELSPLNRRRLQDLMVSLERAESETPQH